MSIRIKEQQIRRILGIVLPSCFVILTVLPFFLFSERLPDPIAIHWGTGGRLNGSAPLSLIVILLLVFVSIPSGAMFFSSRRNPA